MFFGTDRSCLLWRRSVERERGYDVRYRGRFVGTTEMPTENRRAPRSPNVPTATRKQERRRVGRMPLPSETSGVARRNRGRSSTTARTGTYGTLRRKIHRPSDRCRARISCVQSKRWKLKGRLGRLQDALASNLWLIPLIAFVALARGLLLYDQTFGTRSDAWFVYGGSSSGARQMLSTIAGSMITFIGMVFSSTIVVLQLASSQYSSRVLREFFRDRVIQTALGTFIATFAYAILVLREIREEPGHSFVPGLSVYVGMSLVWLSLAMFVTYLNHIVQRIRPVTIIEIAAPALRRIGTIRLPSSGPQRLRKTWLRETTASLRASTSLRSSPSPSARRRASGVTACGRFRALRYRDDARVGITAAATRRSPTARRMRVSRARAHDA